MSGINDPTGLFSATLGGVVGTFVNMWGPRGASALHGLVRKITNFKGEYEGLADDFRTSEPQIRTLKQVFEREPASPDLEKWLKTCEEVLNVDDFITQCKDLDARRPGWSTAGNFHKIKDKYQHAKEIHEIREKINNLLTVQLQVSLVSLKMRSQVSPSYLEQDVPEQLVQVPKFNEIIGSLISLNTSPASNEKWIGIWGPGGCGKTIVAKQINNHQTLVICFKGLIFFVAIGQAAIKEVVLRKLCKLVQPDYNSQGDDENTLKTVLLTALRGKKALLILDDVWHESFLDMLEVVDAQAGSKIFITTRNRELLLLKGAKEFDAALMDFKDSRRLFCNHAFGVDNDCPADESIRKCTDEVTRVCKGLPLALAIAGKALAMKDHKLWEHEIRTIKQKCILPGCRLKGVFEYGYEQLDPVEQECFLTMLSFPEDHIIKYEEELVPWWRGEDLIGPLHEGGWDKGAAILWSLESRSLIQRHALQTYRIHDMILELGLEHLLKDDLQSHEQGHLFLSSEKHREKFLTDFRTNRASLKNVRKIAYRGGPWSESCKENLQGVLQVAAPEFHSLQTIIWNGVVPTLGMDDYNERWNERRKKENFLTEVFSKVVNNSSEMKVAMLDVRSWSRTRDHALTFEFRSALVQTLTIAAGSTRIEIGGSVSGLNLRCLKLQHACFLQPQQLHNLEMLDHTSEFIPHLNVMRNLVKLRLYDYPPVHSFRLHGMCMSNIRHLDVDGKDIELKWPPGTSGRVPFLKLETVRARGVRDGGEWIPLISGDCPELTHLSLEGRLGAMDSMQSMTSGRICLPALKTLFVWNDENDDEPPPELPGIVTHSDLQTMEDLDLNGFQVSEPQGVTLHRFEQLQILRIILRGPLPHSLVGHPKAFLHLKKLTLCANMEIFPLIGEGALPHLQVFQLHQLVRDQHNDADVNSMSKVVTIGAIASGNFKLEKLELLEVSGPIRFKRIPAQLILSPSLKALEFDYVQELEKLELEPGTELGILGSSLESLHICRCPKMTLENGIPEAFKQMQQNGKLNITFKQCGRDSADEDEDEDI